MRGLLLASATALCRVLHLARTPDKLIQGMLRRLGRAYLPTLGVSQPSLVLFRMLPKDSTSFGFWIFKGSSTKDLPIEFLCLKSSAEKQAPRSYSAKRGKLTI